MEDLLKNKNDLKQIKYVVAIYHQIIEILDTNWKDIVVSNINKIDHIFYLKNGQQKVDWRDINLENGNPFYILCAKIVFAKEITEEYLNKKNRYYIVRIFINNTYKQIEFIPDKKKVGGII